MAKEEKIQQTHNSTDPWYNMYNICKNPMFRIRCTNFKKLVRNTLEVFNTSIIEDNLGSKRR